MTQVFVLNVSWRLPGYRRRYGPKMQTLRDIADQAVAATATDPDGGLDIDDIFELLDVRGNANLNLANPLNRDPDVFYFRPRSQPLTGNEPVNGQFLSLEFCGHEPDMILTDHPDLKSLESEILGDRGILNPFTTYLVAFINYRAAPYRVIYRDADGREKQFNKHDQYTGDDPFDTEYVDCRVEWLCKQGT